MKFDTRTLVLMAIAIVINVVVGQLAVWVKLPLYIDAVGTVLVAILAGPLAGAVTGVLTNLIWGLVSDPVAAAFFPVSLVVGLVAGLMARLGWFRTLGKTAVSGVVVGVISTIVAVPIIVYMFGGVTGAGTDFATAYFVAVGQELIKSVAVANLATNLIDKILTCAIAWIIASRMPGRFTASFPFYQKANA
ncbi:ECF transporter S component [Mesorhizobium sp. BAC0120]|uniref:ECF transporter S component n=1 Tax=Mesorhizobium sp. BAC0120 TaxID=3090670 RepID=UPI00298C79E0|nr:ECF transporter S component [Mesorhizobium sp. BAC0120]MDW6023214.1 ECF transporter S component [Mesorhizobium sp. BAC0120]